MLHGTVQDATAPADPAYRLGLVILGLCQVVANQFKKDPTKEPFIHRIYTSLRRRLTRFERVFARAQAELSAVREREAAARAAVDAAASAAGGDTAPASPVRAEVDPAGAERSSATGPGKFADPFPDPISEGARRKIRRAYVRLPRKRGWMLDMMSHEAALYWFRLDMLLREPDMVAFLAISRKARRLLRPLWYALCIDPLPPCLREPPSQGVLGAPPLVRMDAASMRAESSGANADRQWARDDGGVAPGQGPEVVWPEERPPPSEPAMDTCRQPA